LIDVSGTLYFIANDATHGEELWKSDGTSAGTVMVKDIRPGSEDAFPGNLTNVNGTLFFTANDGTQGTEVWKSDGTSGGTVLVKDIQPGNPVMGPSWLTGVGATLFFAANDGTHGVELWKSDGTSTGTVLVRDIWPAGTGSDSTPGFLTDLNGTLLFSADDGTHDTELWKSDGTSAGTVLVKDISFINESAPQDLVNVNGELLFTAMDFAGNHGRELWRSDGTAAGTVLVKDIRPFINSSEPSVLTNVNGTLFFRADDGTHGAEPWALEVPATSTVAGRRLFYNHSAFDANNASITTSDDAAIAIDKTAYLPGDGLAEFDHVSSYSRGINGIMIDLVGGGTHGGISLSTLASDFVFKVGNNNIPSSWTAAPSPNAVSVRANFDFSGTDRIVIVWADGAIRNRWLEVQVLPTSRTGLTATDVFFWGSKIGDIGNPTPTTFSTTAADDAGPIISSGLGPAGGITNPRDIDRSNTITAAGDRASALANIGAITRINIGTGGPFAPDGDDDALATGTDEFGIASALTATSTPVPPPMLSRTRSPNRPDNAHSGLRGVAFCFEQSGSSEIIESSLAVDVDNELDELLDLLVGSTST
jgi:ELWxxDGT repeat protein